MHADAQAKPQVMTAQRQLLESRYDLTPAGLGGENVAGQTATGRANSAAGSGTDWNTLAGMTPDAIRQRNLFPYPALPHPKQVAAGRSFRRCRLPCSPGWSALMWTSMSQTPFSRIPAGDFPANRPELGDVSRGEVVSINNSMPCSKICSPQSSSTASAYF